MDEEVEGGNAEFQELGENALSCGFVCRIDSQTADTMYLQLLFNLAWLLVNLIEKGEAEQHHLMLM